MAKSKTPGAGASIGPRRNRRITRRRLTALFVTVGILAQIAWLMAWSELDTPYEGSPTANTNPNVTGYLVVGSIGSALLFCAVLLYVPEGIQRARQAHRDKQEFKDRFR
jgi:hypothetical protein